MTLGQNIQTARKAKGISQEALAEKIGVSRQALGKWEKDTALPGVDNLQALAKELGVSGYLVKPIDEKSLIPSIELAVARHQEVRRLQRDMAKVSERLENRSIIEKAKGRIMERDGLSEQQAYDFIRKLSLTKGVSMRRIAEIILMQTGS